MISIYKFFEKIICVIHCDLLNRALSKMGVDEKYIIDNIVTYTKFDNILKKTI